jgi:Kdo2-lipid IVA lauroyltransferase/acyltransferase
MIPLLRLAARIPLPILHCIGVALGWIVYGFSGRFRKFLAANLVQAGYSAPTILRQSVGETGKAILELPAIWLRGHADAAALVTAVEGWELIDKTMAAGKGLILLTPHLGCWEVSAQYFSRYRPLTVLYSAPKVRGLEPLMREGRDRNMMSSVPADLSGVRALYRALKRGEAIGMLPDQVPAGGEGEWSEFFARPAYTMTLATRMAQSSGAPVLIVYAERLPRGRGFHLHFEPLAPAQQGERPARRMNRGLETLIRRCPSQYLWAYNRYKVPAGVNPP